MKEFIDLGCGLDSKPMESSEAPKKYYPCFSFTCDEKIDLPDGEFTFVAKGRCVDSGENKRDEDEPRYRYEIEVHGFKPMEGTAKEKAVASFKDVLDEKMSKKKQERQEEY